MELKKGEGGGGSGRGMGEKVGHWRIKSCCSLLGDIVSLDQWTLAAQERGREQRARQGNFGTSFISEDLSRVCDEDGRVK